MDGRATTYGELEVLADAAARRLAALGVHPGDRVASTLPAGVEFAALLHAAPRVGAALVPLGERLSRTERRAQVEEAAARLVVEEPLTGPEAVIDAGAGPHPDATWTVLFTSGTTGRPKPVELSRRNHLSSAVVSAWALGVAPDDRWLCVLPVSHVGGLAVLVRSVVYGTAAVVHPSFDAPRAAAALGEGEVTLASLVPTMLRRMADAGLEAAPGVRAILLGGASSPPDLLEWAARRGLPVLRTYGMTETASQVATADSPKEANGLHRKGDAEGSTGARPLPGVSLRIGEGGEILVRGPMVARGSAGGDGWLRTGDLGRIDARGLLHVHGRLDDVIVTGGENVASGEVEKALLRHPAVSDAGVVGLPDPEWGEVVTAVVVATGQVEAAELRHHLRERLAGFKVPKEVVFVPALPRGPTGKLDRRRLARALRRGPGG